MKRVILTFAFAVAFSDAAQAQIPVTDLGSLVAQARSLAQDIKGYLLQAQQYTTEAQHLYTTEQMLQGFVHDPSLGRAAGLMQMTGLNSSLPVSPYAIMSLTSGYNSMTSLGGVLGKLSQLNGLVGGSYNTNHVYSPTDGTWASQQLIANGNATAFHQGAALSVYQDLQSHIPVLAALRDRLNSATTPKDVADANAAIAAEASWTNNMQAQLAALQVNASAQSDIRIQRDNEALDKSFDDWLTKANAAGRGIN